jgi:acetolactate synthase-1/2/3 large subunit
MENQTTKSGKMAGSLDLASCDDYLHGFPPNPVMTMRISGAEIVIKSLQEEKVAYVFGYPGGSVLHIYDELFKQDEIRHILVRHEQAAVHAADAYSRSSFDKVGVALVTSGPGVTNAITGIATAYSDSVPLVVLCGQVPTAAIGQDAFQEVDTVGITRPCVKHNFLVKDVRDLAMTMKKAFHIATTGRPGPVVVDLPKNITAEKCEFQYPAGVAMRSYHPVIKGHLGQIRKAAQLLSEARRPIFYIGGGVALANAAAPLAELARRLDVPVINTLMALGCFPGTDRQNLGMPGMHGTYEANMALHHADVVLVVGARFDDRVVGNVEHFSAEPRKIIHIDIDPSSISKRVKADVPIVGHVTDVLEEMLKLQEEGNLKPSAGGLDDWWAEIAQWRARNGLAYTQQSRIMPQFVVEKLYEVTGGKAFVTSDVGQHQMFAAQFYKFDEPRRWINSGGQGTMGVGLPYAMGTSFANPGATVACVTGEGSIQMCIQELSTCKQFELPIKIINLNNGMLGMVRQWQEMFYSKRYSESYVTSLPDFVRLAEAYGHVGMKIEHPEDVKPALEKAFGEYRDRLVFMDFIIDPTANVFPMVAAGKGLTEMMLAEDM